MKILGIAGSLRAGSSNRRLLTTAAAVLAEVAPDAVLTEYQGLAELPPYSEDTDRDPPRVVRALRAAIADADAVLIATPEYNSSIPGVLKNALDWASRPYPDNSLRGKPAAVIGASAGLFGAVWAQAETRKVLSTIGAAVLDAELPVGQAAEAFDERDQLRDPEKRATLATILGELARSGQVVPAHG